MVTTCHNNDVGVIVDTTAQTSGTGWAGDTFTKYVYPGTYQYQDFHHTQCGASGGQISNYDDATEVQSCELGGKPKMSVLGLNWNRSLAKEMSFLSGLDDLATETQYVRSRLAQYINDLISLGVDGLRLDASKCKA
ncbi:hypothetical protein FRB98_004963 [Tulasnella sp. 332]|nr:hypothetical protein FRB98_004963 [Tulasnella sp. 332]